ncbi:DUF2480 family protein [Chitinophaga pendula]|uniref:DUF2480 family protein n=1 Tax=Chitinophaga TaxID=79328 RepID=UPI000BB0C573|nr:MULTISPECIES: DUF2480 family protein [Chitinophaga]ASZ13810.1 hypothetical protein CK934_24065 [Chitinophaga sp. MD30]UCJ08570.1 DUF2480 family protein [Chitinophaga pendula]
MDNIRNRIAESGIIVVDLLQYRPDEREMDVVDIAPWLQQGLLFKEKDFRAAVATVDWSAYSDRYVTICCSTDAIVPYWAFAFVAVHLQPYAAAIGMGSLDQWIRHLWLQQLDKAAFSAFGQQKIVLKARNEVPPEIYVKAATLLNEHVASLMYGEAGSPIILHKRTTK